jgi:excisionase family DNA binding protein
MDPILTIPQVAEYLSVSERTVWRMIADGRLATIKFGSSTRIRESELSRFLDEL